jgi:hypothetical protein
VPYLINIIENDKAEEHATKAASGIENIAPPPSLMFKKILLKRFHEMDESTFNRLLYIFFELKISIH